MIVVRVHFDGSRFQDLNGFYDEASRILLAPGTFWGRNLDAFADILHGGFPGPLMDGQVILVWERSDKSALDLGYPATVAWLEGRLPRVHPTGRASWVLRLEEARRSRGPTLFDQLVQVIEGQVRSGGSLVGFELR